MMKKFKSLSTSRKISFIVFSLLTLFILWFIFSHSAKPAAESSADSEGLSHMVAELINKLFNSSLTSDDTVWWVRTFAHFAEFTALTFCVSTSIESIAEKNKANFIISFPFGVITAFCDETIQTFFEGRAFQISDIFIDSLGSISGIIFFALVLKIILCFKKERNG